MLGVLLLAYCLATSWAMPSDWQRRYDQGNLLFSATAPSTPSLVPSVGNGYVATVVYSDTTFISGVFNGVGDVTPSHRIPGYTAVDYSVDGPSSLIGWALDLKEAAFMKRTQVGSGYVEQRMYAHRSRRGIFVVEFSLTGAPAVNLTLRVNLGKPSEDIQFVDEKEPNSNVIIHKGITYLAEESYLPCTEVVVAHDDIPSTLFLRDGDRTAILFSFATSLEGSPTTIALQTLSFAHTQTPAELFNEHTEEWAKISSGGVFVKGNLELAQAINSSNYYILSSVRYDWPFSLSPGGLASNSYNGHTFWDCETWMYPPILAFNPWIGRSILEYRYLHLSGARRKARSYNPPLDGAMFPWESAFSGEETCPTGVGTCSREIHISGDIAYAAYQYYAVTGDYLWVKKVGYPMTKRIAQFWLSRLSPDYSINDVIPPDEYHDHVNNSAYTNRVAALSLEIATLFANVSLAVPDPDWMRVARKIPIPYDEQRKIILEYDGYTDDQIKQADVILLAYPLPNTMDDDQIKRNLDFYTPKTDYNGPAMTWAMTAIGYLQVDLLETANKYFSRSFGNIHPPFNVWYETPQGGAVNFITGAGGFLHLAVYGYSGIRFDHEALTLLNFPHLPPNTESFDVIGFAYLDNALDFHFEETVVQIFSNEKGAPLVVIERGVAHKLTTSGLLMKRTGSPLTIQMMSK